MLSLSQGNQLRRDLNETIGRDGNWSIPSFWAPLIRYVAAPILAIVYSFSYPSFYQLRHDPLHIMGFGVGHIALLIIGFGFIVPRWLDVLVPCNRRAKGGANVSPSKPAAVGGGR
jgi:solute carrier family 6 GABA transporter-like protein 1